MYNQRSCIGVAGDATQVQLYSPYPIDPATSIGFLFLKEVTWKTTDIIG